MSESAKETERNQAAQTLDIAMRIHEILLVYGDQYVEKVRVLNIVLSLNALRCRIKIK